MATVKAVHSKASIGIAVNYVTKEEKTEDKLITGKDCDPFNVVNDMNTTKQLWNKEGGRQYDHYVQSWHKDERITKEQAHEIGCKWADQNFKGHEVLIVTHVDRGHLHNHFIVNTVNYENGKKLHTNAKWLKEIKDRSDDLCKEYGLSVTQKGKTFEGKDREDMTAWSKDKYNLLEKADRGEVKSYVLDTAKAVMDCKEQARSKEEFIRLMQERGYQTDWDSRKTVSFKNQDGKTVRNSNLESTFHIQFGKEQLEHEFEQNARSREAERPNDNELYNTLHRIANNERRAEQAYNSINERFRNGENGERTDNGGNTIPRQSREETRTHAERTRTSISKPSEAIREISARVHGNSIEARNAFREHLQKIIIDRRKSKSAVTTTDKDITKLIERRTEAEQELDRLNASKDRLAAELKRDTEREHKRDTKGFDREAR